MNRRILALATATVVGVAAPAPAFDLGLGLFKKKEKKQAEKADAGGEKLLVATLQTDLDEGRRKAAAEGLRKIDPKTGFDGVAALAGAVLKDPSPDVRVTAAESLGTFKVVYQQAATALEKAETDDPDKGVRAAAKAALWQYGLNGYKATTASKGQSAEPPLARAPKTLPTLPPATATKPPTTDVLFRPITQGPGTAGPLPESAEPPLAKSAKPLPKTETKPQPVVAPPPSVPQRMPSKVELPVAPPKVELPAPPLPSPLPLPEVPQPPKVPTVLPPK